MSIKQYALIVLATTGISLTATAQVNPKEKLWQTLKAIQSNYVDSLTDESLVNAAIEGMMSKLDPHSRYFTAEEAAQFQQTMKGSFAGIGIQYLMQNDSLYITGVIEGGPAEKAGLRIGDRVLAIDSVAVKGASNFDIMQKIRGAKGTPVVLDVHRNATGGRFTARIVRQSVPDRSVRAAYMVTDRIGYISLRIFSETTREEVDDALKTLQEQGMKSLILDLQGNGGGSVQAAIALADEFLPKDKLVFYSVGKDKGKDYYYTGGFGRFPEGDLVVLIDQHTASASEILTGALQDWDRAVIVGRRSFGKGLMQRPVPVFDGSVLELTGARYYTPSGRSIQKPYHGASYNDNVQVRFANGELQRADAIRFPDSLKYTTLVSKRTVFGGGGIMPDKFVPIDTTEYNRWLQAVGELNLPGKYSFDYADANRAALLSEYKDFETFNSSYKVPASLVNEIVAAAEKAGLRLDTGSKDRVTELLSLELKGRLASQLYAGNDHYLQVMNKANASLREALRILETPGGVTGVLGGNNKMPVKTGKAKK